MARPAAVSSSAPVRIKPVRMGLAAAIVATVLFAGAAYWSASTGEQANKFSAISEIAVLPLRAQGVTDASLRLRLADAIATRLGEIDRFTVRPTASMAGYDHDQRDPIAIGRLLGVDAILEGRIQDEGGRLRVNLQLVKTETGENIWSGQFDGSPDRLLALQDVISARMIADLGLVNSRTSNAIAKGQPTENSEAYEHYLRGRFFFYKRNGDDLQLAREHFEKAIELDPRFDEAKLGVANICAFRPDLREIAERYVSEVLDADPKQSQAYAIRGFIKSFHDWNWNDGEADLLYSVELDPNNSLARQWYANTLMVRGRYSEAEAHFLRALELDPASVPLTTDLGQLYYYQRRLDEAESVLTRAISMQGDHVGATGMLNLTLIVKNKAEREQRNDPVLTPKEIAYKNGIANNETIYKKQETQRIDVSQHLPYVQSWKYAFEGDRDETIKHLRIRLARRHFMLPFDVNAPMFAFLRDDPEFNQIVMEMNLPAFAASY
jgi:TolB-like protein